MGTITKALNLLNYFTSLQGELGLADFVRLTDGDKATVRRHLQELEANGFLEQHPKTRKYRLGSAVLRLASIRENHLPIRAAIVPVVEKMAVELQELVHASLLQGRTIAPVFHSHPQRGGLRVSFHEGEPLPLHATATGLTLLAFGPERLLDTVLAEDLEALTPFTLTDPEQLLALVETVRAFGYSFSDQFNTADIVSYALPFFGPDGHAIGALSVALPLSRHSDAFAERILEELHAGCGQITRSCGGAPPPSWPGVPSLHGVA